MWRVHSVGICAVCFTVLLELHVLLVMLVVLVMLVIQTPKKTALRAVSSEFWCLLVNTNCVAMFKRIANIPIFCFEN